MDKNVTLMFFGNFPGSTSSRASDSLLIEAELDFAAIEHESFWILSISNQFHVPVLGAHAFFPLYVTSIHCLGIITGSLLELPEISARGIILSFGTQLLSPLLLVFFPKVLGTLGDLATGYLNGIWA
jgi:hypothetical protein